MDPTSACPDEAELFELARGTISEERGTVLRDHIGDCKACRVAVAELTSATDASTAPDAAREPDRYELLRLLGTGGMGEVFQARDNLLGRDVAIKLLHEDLSSPESLGDSRRRLLREARALARFVHPNVVAVYDVGVLDGRAFLSMEFVPGPTMRQWIAQFNPELSRVLDVLVQAGQGLLAAHEAGLVHSDFKPDNILVGEDGRAKVTDFGLARRAASPTERAGSKSPEGDLLATSSATLDGVICGTPAYMAPEQLRGAPTDARSDQYAFAVTLFETLHGKRPGADQGAPRDRTIDPVAPTVPIAPGAFPPLGGSDRAAPAGPRGVRSQRTLVGRIDGAIERALSTDPAARFPSMRELLAAVETARAGSASRPRRALAVGLVAAALGIACGIGALVFAHEQRQDASSRAPSGLHAPCGGPSALVCPSPLACRYSEGNSCGAAGRVGSCYWPYDGCDAKSPPVCGCDGVSYANHCDANLHGSAIAYHGACVSCQAGAACADVAPAGARAPTFCRVSDGPGPSGVCWPRPSSCDAGGAPVCAWDGRSYPSQCEARRAGFDARELGPCPGDVSQTAAPASYPESGRTELAFGAPDEVGVDAGPLLRLAQWVEAESLPIYSLLISRDGVVVFELYTSSLSREEAHYLMGVTGSVVSALVGAAIDKHVLSSPETSVADALPADLFPNSEVREAWRRVTIRDVLGESALDAPIPPQDQSESARELGRRFLESPNRVAFALTQPLLPMPGTSYQGNAITPQLATGILEYATRKTALELAEKWLFLPMGFAHYEWMHEDNAGIDNGEYGLRLRPVDMQKFGLLFVNDGVYGGERLLSSDWVHRSFSPTIRSSSLQKEPNFGLHWWRVDYGPRTAKGDGRRWTAHVAEGWKGQRIAVFPEARVVVTMTGVVEPPEDDAAIFRRVIRDHVIPAVDGTGTSPPRPDPSVSAALGRELEAVRKTSPFVKHPPEARMVPTVRPHETHHGFQP